MEILEEKNSILRNIIKIILIILVITLLGVIFAFSSQSGEKSTGLSRKISEKVVNHIESLQSLKGEARKEAVLYVEIIIRKLAHFSIYMFFGILFMGLMETFNLKDGNKLLCSLGIGITYAISDEVHQMFVPGRTALVTDVLIDSFGLLVGICMVLICTSIIRKIKYRAIKV